MQDGSQNLAHLGNVAAGELELAESILEELEALGVVDANLELGGVTEVPPALGVVKTKVGLFGMASTGEEVVEDVEVALAGRDSGDTAPLEAVGQELTTEQGGVGGDGGVVLQLVEETSLGRGRGGGRLGGGEGVEDVGSVGQLGGQGGGRLVEDGREEVRAKGRLAGTRLATGFILAYIHTIQVPLDIRPHAG